MAGRGQQQAGMAGPQNGPPQQTMQNGGQPYGQPYAHSPGQAPQQPPMWSSAAPIQPQFGSVGMQGMQPPQMAGQPTNNYYSTYNQPVSQAQQQPSGGLLEPTAPVAETAPNPATPEPVATQPAKTNSNVTNPLTAAQNQVQTPAAPDAGTVMQPPAPPNMGNFTNTINSLQNQAQNPVAPPQPAYTPPQPAYTPPPAASQPAYNNNPAVNGIVPRPEGTPDYTRDRSNDMGGIPGLVRNMQQEVSPTNYNLSPDAPLMNQGQQNLVNMGLDPMIARIYGSRG